MTETWRAIPGFEGSYEVSDQGRVRSLPRSWPQQTVKGTWYIYRKKGQILRPGRATGGHLTVVLGRDGGSHCVHALVMLAFEGPPPAGHEVRHLDGEHRNNVRFNLEYATRSRNVQDKKWHKGQIGYRLTPGQVADIKHRFAEPYFGIGADMAREYGVAQSTISAIKHERFHRDVVAHV